MALSTAYVPSHKLSDIVYMSQTHTQTRRCLQQMEILIGDIKG